MPDFYLEELLVLLSRSSSIFTLEGLHCSRESEGSEVSGLKENILVSRERGERQERTEEENDWES